MKATTIYDAIAHVNTSPLYGIHVGTLTSPMRRSDGTVAPKASQCLEVDYHDCQTIKVPLRFVDGSTKRVVEETSADSAIVAILKAANVKAHLISRADTSVMIG